jgi:hypothetical protein
LHETGRTVSLNSGENDMATKLDKTLKREIEIDGQLYTVAISPEGIKVTQKGFRKGSELTWKQILGSASSEGTSGAEGAATGSAMSGGAGGSTSTMSGSAGGGGMSGGGMGGGGRMGGTSGTSGTGEGGAEMPSR